MHVTADELLALLLGEVGPARAAEVGAHVERCAECARELAWARAERALIARRPAPRADALWEGIVARLAAQQPTSLGGSELSRPAGERDPVGPVGEGASPARRAGPFGQRASASPVIPRASAVSSTPASRRARWARRAAAGAAVAAAVAVGISLRPRPPGPVAAEAVDEGDSVDPRALAALDKAEGDYRNAAAILEKEYEAARPRLDPRAARRWDASLQQERAQLGGASALAAKDPNARLRVLDGYAGYLRTLHEVIEQSEEAGP